MEDIIQSLKAAAQPQMVPLALPDEDMLIIIEEELLLPIPADVKQFLLTVSNIIYGSIEPVTATEPQAHTYLPEVTAEAWANGLPRHYLPICQVANDYYCVDESGEVFFWKDGELTEQNWEDIWQWTKEVWLNNHNSHA